MALKDHFISDLVANQYNTDDFAQMVVYKPIEGFDKSIRAVVSAYKGDEYRGGDAYGQTKTVRIINDATYGRALPVHGDTIEIDEVDYTVRECEPINDSLEWEIIADKKAET